MLRKFKTVREFIKSEFEQYFPHINYTLRFTELDGIFSLEIEGYNQDWAQKQYKDDEDAYYNEHAWDIDFKKLEEFVVALRQNDLELTKMEMEEGAYVVLRISDK